MPKDLEYGPKIMELLVKEIIRRLEVAPEEMKAADFEMVRKLLSDNAITLASVQAGNFGEFAASVAKEQFPFPEESPASYQ